MIFLLACAVPGLVDTGTVTSDGAFFRVGVPCTGASTVFEDAPVDALFQVERCNEATSVCATDVNWTRTATGEGTRTWNCDDGFTYTALWVE